MHVCVMLCNDGGYVEAGGWIYEQNLNMLNVYCITRGIYTSTPLQMLYKKRHTKISVYPQTETPGHLCVTSCINHMLTHARH
jgi:hypothetical protein